MLTDFYIDPFDVLRNTQTTDSGGALVDTFSAISTGNKGYFEALSGDDRNVVNAKKQLTASYRLLCEPDVDVIESDQISIYDVIYQVAFIINHRLGMNRHTEILLGLPNE